jgi:hypothetical protein
VNHASRGCFRGMPPEVLCGRSILQSCRWRGFAFQESLLRLREHSDEEGMRCRVNVVGNHDRSSVNLISIQSLGEHRYDFIPAKIYISSHPPMVAPPLTTAFGQSVESTGSSLHTSQPPPWCSAYPSGLGRESTSQIAFLRASTSKSPHHHYVSTGYSHSDDHQPLTVVPALTLPAGYKPI